MYCSKNPKKYYNTQRKALHLLEGLVYWSFLRLASNNPNPVSYMTLSFSLFLSCSLIPGSDLIHQVQHGPFCAALLSLLAQVCTPTAFPQVLLMHSSGASMNSSGNSKDGAVTVFKALVDSNQLL